jgi:CYTH domain-containing protein
MDKTAQNEFHRLFLIEGLPEPLTPMSSHLQIFDNYIEHTRLRLRNIRVPETREWRHILQQRFRTDSDPTHWKKSEIYLNDLEYAAFERFEGHEIRKNRYFHEVDGMSVDFDIYLGPLWGLCMARCDFRNINEMQSFEPFPFALMEVSADPFFDGSSLVTKIFADVQAQVARIGSTPTQFPTARDE